VGKGQGVFDRTRMSARTAERISNAAAREMHWT